VFDHVAIRAADRSASERFYRTTLGAIGIEPSETGEETIGWDDFWLADADADHPPTRHLHLAFVAPSREGVDAFWRAGRDAGYEDEGAPGERPQYTAGYYGAFLRDPDGNSAEAVHHADVRRGGHIDHLWIGVRDLEAAAAFYAAVMPHVGLREGRRWEGGRQLRGAWATFSLVADGRPPTEGLRIAFQAPDPQTVEDFRRAAKVVGHRDRGSLDGPAPTPDPGCRAAYVLDPDGTSVGSVFRPSR
jgi:catechol 2,3-dioxygenase-like lactoylglutathione lyase family enzyme